MAYIIMKTSSTGIETMLKNKPELIESSRLIVAPKKGLISDHFKYNYNYKVKHLHNRLTNFIEICLVSMFKIINMNN